jgi:hypothetical protein
MHALLRYLNSHFPSSISPVPATAPQAPPLPFGGNTTNTDAYPTTASTEANEATKHVLTGLCGALFALGYIVAFGGIFEALYRISLDQMMTILWRALAITLLRFGYIVLSGARRGMDGLCAGTDMAEEYLFLSCDGLTTMQMSDEEMLLGCA